MRPKREAIAVDPARLNSGTYDHSSDRQIADGDVHGSYSGDRIGEGKPIRRPFRHDGQLYVTTSICGSGLTASGLEEHEAYRLVRRDAFPGDPTTYRDKVSRDSGEMARADPNGFYDRMTVKSGADTYILCGPPVVFVPGAAPVRPEAHPARVVDERQLTLF